MTPTVDDIRRLEDKLDILTDAITKLVLFEERQSIQALAIAKLTDTVTAVERKLDMWVNRGMGVWAVAAVMFAVFKTMGS